MDMKKKQVFYDKKTDALWIRMKKGAEASSEEIAPGMSVEYDTRGGVIGVEVLRASRLFTNASNSSQRVAAKSPLSRMV